MRRYRWAMLLVLLPLCALVGDTGSRAQTPAVPKGRILLATVSSNYREGLLRLAAEYEKIHPEIEVQIQVQPVNGYETWLRTQIGSDSAPDIYNVNYTAGFYE